MSLPHYFDLPYPYYYSFKRSLLFSMGSGFFVFLFLLIFQPFGTYHFEHPNKTLLLAGYGLVAMLVMIVCFIIIPLLFPKVFSEERWTIGKQLTLLALLIICLATACYFYNIRFFNYAFSWKNWGYFIWLTTSVGFFPFLVITLLDYYFKFKKYSLFNTPLHYKEESLSSTDRNLYILTDDALKDKVVFTVDELLFIKSDDNYIEVYLRKGKIDFEKKLIRCALKAAETKLDSLNLIRCHRSYLVNMRNCSSINGNSQGYRLVFDGVPEHIPVSRSKSDDVRFFWNSISATQLV
jgi:LytTr DNA-binding domain